MKPDLKKLESDNISFRQIKVKKKESIYLANEKASGFYYLQSGIIGLYRITETGKEHLLRVYGPDEYFGYRSLFSKERYHLTTRALKTSSILKIDVCNLNTVYLSSPELMNYLVTSVCKELGEAENRLSNIAGYDTKIRVIDSIVELFSRFGDYHWTSREIAEYSGTETQTVIRFCKQLKQRNLLDPKARGIKPLSLENLNQYRVELVNE